MSIRAHIAAARKSFTVWLNALLLAIYPFADAIVSAVQDNLPALAAHLPANIFRAVSLALVVYNIVHAARNAVKKEAANAA